MSRRPPRGGRSGRPFRRSIGLPKPIKEGDERDVTIEAIGSRGDGIAKIQGFIIFVPNTKPGDHVKVRITAVRPNFATGKVISAAEEAAPTEEEAAEETAYEEEEFEEEEE